MDYRSLIEKTALKNAHGHDGKADVGSEEEKDHKEKNKRSEKQKRKKGG